MKSTGHSDIESALNLTLNLADNLYTRLIKSGENLHRQMSK